MCLIFGPARASAGRPPIYSSVATIETTPATQAIHAIHIVPAIRIHGGAALAETDGYAYHDQRFDRERNRQLEAQVYATYDLGAGYLLGNVAFGHMQRWTQREVLLGDQAFRLGTDYAQRYASAAVQAGLPLRMGRGRLTPYAGVQSLRLYLSANDVFSLSKFPKYLDPESGSYSYPIVTTFMAGATIRF